MNIITLYGISLAINYFMYDYIHLQQRIKVILGYPPHQFLKPFDCRLCMFFWFSFVFSLFLLYNIKLFVIFNVINFAFSNLINKIHE